MPRRNRKRSALKTLLIVGEGEHDQAFVKYLCHLYDCRRTGQKVAVKAGDGGSPEELLRVMMRRYQHAAYDRRVLLLDEDVPIPQAVTRDAGKRGIDIVVSKPICLEGMLLELLGESIPPSARNCKNVLHPMLSGDPADKQSYARCIQRSLLDQSTNSTLVHLRRLISNEDVHANPLARDC